MATVRNHTTRQFFAAVQTLEDRLWDEKFARELYQALSSRRWCHDGSGEALSLSWQMAADMVNELRELIDYPQLALDQTGGEGTVTDEIAERMSTHGWRSEPLDVDRHQPDHVTSEEDAPPASR